jgi:hypothetical protein
MNKGFGGEIGRRSRRRWESIKLNLKEKGWRSMYYINLSEDRDQWWALVNAVTNLRLS